MGFVKQITMAFGIICLAGAASANANGWPATCSNASLKGTYLYSLYGTREATPEEPATIISEAGFELFDGHRTVVRHFTNAKGEADTLVGEYDISVECEGVIRWHPTDQAEWSTAVYIDPKGNLFSHIDTRTGYRSAGLKTRVSKALIGQNGHPPRTNAWETTKEPAWAKTHPVCSNRTLSGTYVYEVIGNGTGDEDKWRTAFRESGNETFDGRGNIINRFTDSNGAVGTVVGSYAVDSDCTGTTTYLDTEGTTLTFDIYVSPYGDRFTFIDQDPSYTRCGENIRVSPLHLLQSSR